MLLQERIQELNSGILKFEENKIKVIGFLSPERLLDYYEKNKQCFFSKELYDYENLEFKYIKDNALFIILKSDKSIEKHQFVVIKKDTFKIKTTDIHNKSTYISKTYRIRKCNFSNLYNYIDSDNNLLFTSFNQLKTYLFDKYNLVL